MMDFNMKEIADDGEVEIDEKKKKNNGKLTTLE